MNTVVIKQNENGNFAIAASSALPVKVLLVESDLIGESNALVDGEQCIVYNVDTEINASLVSEVVKQLDGVADAEACSLDTQAMIAASGEVLTTFLPQNFQQL